MRPTLLLRAGLATCAALLVSACAGSATGSGPDATAPAFHGPQPAAGVTRPSFTLTDTSGKPYDFDAETKGHPTYVYFGYTHCPDQCPTAMADLAAAMRKVTPAERADTRVVFVTTDPRRDTRPVIRQWLDQFSPTFIGLTGTQAAVNQAAVASGLAAGVQAGPQPTLPGRPDAHPETPGTAPHKHFGPLGYAVDHANLILAYDTHDQLPVIYPGGVTPSDIAADLHLLSGA